MKLQILLNDYYDISDYCIELSEIRESVEESLSTDNTYSITVFNKNNWCDIFNGFPLSHFNVYVRDIHSNNKLILKGTLIQANPKDNQKAEIVVKNTIIDMDKNIIQSYYYKTLKELFILFSKDYNLNFDMASVSCLSENNYEYSVRVNADESLKICDMLSQISEAIGIFIYTSRGVIYAKPFNRIGNSLYFSEIDKDDILVWEKEKSYDKIVNNLSVKYYMNQDTPIGDVNNLGKTSRFLYGEKAKDEIDVSQNSNFIVMSHDGALQCITNYITRFKNIIEINKMTFRKEYFIELVLGEWYLIDDKYYQLITKALTTNGNKCECEFWSL